MCAPPECVGSTTLAYVSVGIWHIGQICWHLAHSSTCWACSSQPMVMPYTTKPIPAYIAAHSKSCFPLAVAAMLKHSPVVAKSLTVQLSKTTRLAVRVSARSSTASKSKVETAAAPLATPEALDGMRGDTRSAIIPSVGQGPSRMLKACAFDKEQEQEKYKAPGELPWWRCSVCTKTSHSIRRIPTTGTILSGKTTSGKLRSTRCASDDLACFGVQCMLSVIIATLVCLVDLRGPMHATYQPILTFC